MQRILRRKVREASFTLSAKAGLPASIQELNGTWIKVRQCYLHQTLPDSGHCISRLLCQDSRLSGSATSRVSNAPVAGLLPCNA